LIVVVVDLATAVICFAQVCYPALIGKQTPPGLYQLKPQVTEQANYGGDILVYREDATTWYAVHRVIDVRGQRRLFRLKSKDPRMRRDITGGCINVEPEVYEQLEHCCSTDTLQIR
jgi:hypothetical protein